MFEWQVPYTMWGCRGIEVVREGGALVSGPGVPEATPARRENETIGIGFRHRDGIFSSITDTR
jgi:hypothetical protein